MGKQHIAIGAIFGFDFIDSSAIPLCIQIKNSAVDLPVFLHHAAYQCAHKAQTRLMKTTQTIQLHDLTGRPHGQYSTLTETGLGS